MIPIPSRIVSQYPRLAAVSLYFFLREFILAKVVQFCIVDIFHASLDGCTQ